MRLAGTAVLDARCPPACLQEGAAAPQLPAGGGPADPSGLAAVQRMLHQQQSARSTREAQPGAAPGHSLSRTATGLSRDSRRSLRKSPTSSSLGEHHPAVCLPGWDLTWGAPQSHAGSLTLRGRCQRPQTLSNALQGL